MHARSPSLDLFFLKTYMLTCHARPESSRPKPGLCRKAGCEMSVSNGTRTASIADQLVIETGDGSAEFGEPIDDISGVFLITRIVKVDVT